MPREDAEAARIRQERESEARRNAWIETSASGGMSRSAASTTTRAPTCDGPSAKEREAAEAQKRAKEQHQRAARETAKKDKPLEPDHVGNAIPGLIVGGLMAGLEAAAGGAGLGGIASSVGKHAGEHVAADAVEHGAHAIFDHGPKTPAQKPGATTPPAASAAPPGAPAASAPPGAPASVAGRSGPHGTSEAAPEARESPAPQPPAGQDRVPYAPGRAPARIPEAPRGDVAPPTVIRG